MASMQERAATLNLAEKLSARAQAHRLTSRSVQVLSTWSDLIFHLRSSVTVKDRRLHLKTHSDCFLSSEAVDVVAEHFKHLVGVNVPRDKVVCVCRAMLDFRVFESVGTKVFGNDKKRHEFQDSKSCLYRFVDAPLPAADELERVLLVNGVHTLFCSPCSESSEEQIRSTPLETGMTGSLGESSASPSRAQAEAVVPQALARELWQEQTLLRLLNLVELPLLEGPLQCMRAPLSPLPSQRHDKPDPTVTFSSSQLDRQILRAFTDSREDEWLHAAVDCLDFLPDLPVVELSRELPHRFPQYEKSSENVPDVDTMVSNHSGDEQLQPSQAGLSRWKLQLYGTLVKHYSQTDRPPLLPQLMTDVYTAIIDLLIDAKLATALEALQLYLKLLPHGCREQLRRLLTFMSLAADPRGIKLEQEMENRRAVIRSFSRAIVPKSVSKEKGDLMLVFMLSNVEEIFKVPGALHKLVSEKLAGIKDGQLPDVAGSRICQEVSSGKYRDSTQHTTNQELLALLKSIHLDTKLSEKERKRMLRKFYGAHPTLFTQYFGDSAVSGL